jgi:hypothetical protein
VALGRIWCSDSVEPSLRQRSKIARNPAKNQRGCWGATPTERNLRERTRSLEAVAHQATFDEEHGVLGDSGDDVGQPLDALGDGQQLDRSA